LNTAVVYSPEYLKHDTGPNHPETPSRLEAIMSELNKSGLLLETKKCAIVNPKPASKEDLELVHETDYIELVQRTCQAGGGLLDLSDTVVSRESFNVALLAAGGVLDAVNLVSKGKARNAFALIRPPGHHAGPYYALGFCLFNNIAIAANYLTNRVGLQRVAILDIDAHHGNGTQEIFYNTNKVLYVSLHEDPRGFPGTGFEDEIGEGEGRGYTVNVPLPFKSDDRICYEAFDHIAAPILRQFKPDFMLVSAGFDGHYTDPIGDLALSMQGYAKIFSKILGLVSRLCDNKIVVALEGGYSLSFLGKMVTVAIARMSGIEYNVRDNVPVSSMKVRKKAEQVIKNVRKIQSEFWQL
jgi:acetoin utilization deacetylase AcuC-like enzyme